MKTLQTSILTLLVGLLLHSAAADEQLLDAHVIPLEPCAPCESQKCPSVPTDCSVGVLLDRCGCCQVCGLEESHRCNPDGDMEALIKGEADKPWYGRCGDNLACEPRTDVDAELVGTENSCQCQVEGSFCASDGKTYSFCQLSAATKKSGGEIQQEELGYCHSIPKIFLNTTKSEVDIGEDVTLSCEVVGYPRPDIKWYFTKHGSSEIEKLPGTSTDITTLFRGEESPMKLFSFLQIIKFKRTYQGTYKCEAENSLGVSHASANLVLQSQEL